jgi:hypothetical protein
MHTESAAQTTNPSHDSMHTESAAQTTTRIRDPISSDSTAQTGSKDKDSVIIGASVAVAVILTVAAGLVVVFWRRRMLCWSNGGPLYQQYQGKNQTNYENHDPSPDGQEMHAIAMSSANVGDLHRESAIPGREAATRPATHREHAVEDAEISVAARPAGEGRRRDAEQYENVKRGMARSAGEERRREQYVDMGGRVERFGGERSDAQQYENTEISVARSAGEGRRRDAQQYENVEGSAERYAGDGSDSQQYVKVENRNVYSGLDVYVAPQDMHEYAPFGGR